MGLCAIALGVMFRGGVPLPLAIILTLALGAVCGLINAGLIIYTGVNPFEVITTGDVVSVWRQRIVAFRDGRGDRLWRVSAVSRKASSILPTLMCWAYPYLLFFLVSVLFPVLLMHRTHAGRNVFLIGQKPARGAV